MNNAFMVDQHSEPSFFIKFYPEIKSSIGCEKATLILGRFEYWFTKYKNGFYKFIEPCNHPLYRTGDSWAEEIGFSRKVFSKAFDLIGIRYKSKSEFKNSRDKFQGKLYASYHDRKTNQTYFFRNHAFANQFIKNHFKIKAQSASQISETRRGKQEPPVNNESSFPESRSRSVHMGRSFNISIQRNTSSLNLKKENKQTNSLSKTQQKVTEEMIEIWKEEVGEMGAPTSESLLKRLNEVFIKFFNQSIESWKSYCQIISSSKFLMGEAQNKFFKKAWMTWAITEKAIEKIRGGAFKVGDRQTERDKKINRLNLELKELENERKKTTSIINEIGIFTKQERLNKTREKIRCISVKELTMIKKEFEDHLEKEKNSISEQYKKSGWKGLFVDVYFDDFLKGKIESQIFSLSLEEETNKNVMKLGLNQKFQEIYHKTNDIKEKILYFSEKNVLSV